MEDFVLSPQEASVGVVGGVNSLDAAGLTLPVPGSPETKCGFGDELEL